MEAIREIVEADKLAGIFSLPPAFAKRRVEVVIRPIEEKSSINIERFLSGNADWSEATGEELAEGYKAMAQDKDREREAKEWL